MANTTRVVLRTITIVVQEVGARVSALAYFNRRPIHIDAPIVRRVDAAAGVGQKASDVAAEIQNLATAPNRPAQYFIEVAELAFSS